ncbi:MAG: DUF3419 family protein [Pseudomonadota bacterium]
MQDAAEAALPSARGGASRLAKAVHRERAFSAAGLSERLFTFAFSGLVYAQIWEDPAVDMEGLALGPGKRLVCIGSGGCNVMSYLTADPEQVTAVDLNRHHVQLLTLKLAAARTLPRHAMFFEMFGEGDRAENRDHYYAHVRKALPAASRAYWEGRDALGRRRISMLSRGLYAQGLLGRFIAAGHFAARRLGADLPAFLAARDLDEQAERFERDIAPLFDAPIVQRITRRRASLFGLGIPPAQYDSLAKAGGGDMAVVLKERLRKLLCDFLLSENYFAWQALARRYAPGDGGPLPPYLSAANWDAVRERAERASIELASLTDRLGAESVASQDAYVLLDAQDWMTDAQLNALWDEITRTARPGARVLFRTADAPSLLPGRLAEATLARWSYLDDLSQDLTRRDRSAIYGGVHVYELAS